jgi:hypothetical protein
MKENANVNFYKSSQSKLRFGHVMSKSSLENSTYSVRYYGPTTITGSSDPTTFIRQEVLYFYKALLLLTRYSFFGCTAQSYVCVCTI